MVPDRFMTVLRYNTMVFITAVVALVVGLFIFIIPIEILQLTWAKGFELWYTKVLGAAVSITLPGVIIHFIVWDSLNK
nr:MAG TPA: hypothetical protein [Caudoviricetes sp.]